MNIIQYTDQMKCRIEMYKYGVYLLLIVYYHLLNYLICYMIFLVFTNKKQTAVT